MTTDSETEILDATSWKPISGQYIDLVVPDDPWFNKRNNDNKDSSSNDDADTVEEMTDISKLEDIEEETEEINVYPTDKSTDNLDRSINTLVLAFIILLLCYQLWSIVKSPSTYSSRF